MMARRRHESSSFGDENGTLLQEMIDYFHMLSLKFAPFRPLRALRAGWGSLLHTGMHWKELQ